MNITVTIQADEKLITTLEALAYALANATERVSATAETAPVQQSLPLPQAPLQTFAEQVFQPVQPMAQAPVQPLPVQPVAPQPAVVPTTAAPTYTIDQLSVASMQLMDSGRQQDLMNLLSSFGVQALTQLPPQQYGAYATKLRELGAKI